MIRYRIEVFDGQGWVFAVIQAEDGSMVPAIYDTIEAAETDARWSFGPDQQWRVVDFFRQSTATTCALTSAELGSFYEDDAPPHQRDHHLYLRIPSPQLATPAGEREGLHRR